MSYYAVLNNTGWKNDVCPKPKLEERCMTVNISIVTYIVFPRTLQVFIRYFDHAESENPCWQVEIPTGSPEFKMASKMESVNPVFDLLLLVIHVSRLF